MLELAPYQVPSGEDKGRNKEAESGLHTLHIQTEGISVSTKDDSRGGESRIPPPQGSKRTASEDLETKFSKRGKKPLPGGPAPEGVLTDSARKGASPPPVSEQEYFW